MGATAAVNSGHDTSKGFGKPFEISYGKMMMWFFILSDALTFSGFIVAYGFSRFKFIEEWPIADEVFNMVAQFSMKEQMIMLHQKFKTPMIKELSKIMGMSVNSINVATIKDWCEKENTVKRDVYETKRKKKIKIESKGDQSKDNYLLTAKLAKWHKKWSQPEKKTLTGRDLPRFIISPLGQTIYPLLNNMPGMADSLTRIAQQVTLIQVNVNVKTKTLNFTSNFFKRADFKFSWAGYSGGNTLGFSMKMK